MNYALTIREHNLKPHLDLEEEVKERSNGILTFTVRVNNGNIVDLNVTEYIDVAAKYFGVTKIVVQELTVAYSVGERSASDTIRDNNVYRSNSERGS